MYIIIDGITYDVPVLGLDRKAEFLDKYANRSEGSGVLLRELIGVFFNYSLSLGSTAKPVQYNALWDKLTEPTEFHEVTVPDGNGDFTFTAYPANVADSMKRKTAEQNFFKNMTFDFIAKSPARS